MTRDLVCPLCGGVKGSNVTDTRRCTDAIIRVRRCFECHGVFVTTETADACERKAPVPVDPGADATPTKRKYRRKEVAEAS